VLIVLVAENCDSDTGAAVSEINLDPESIAGRAVAELRSAVAVAVVVAVTVVVDTAQSSKATALAAVFLVRDRRICVWWTTLELMMKQRRQSGKKTVEDWVRTVGAGTQSPCCFKEK